MSEGIQPHIEALRHWVAHQAKCSTVAAGISPDERKQLQAVNKSIQQLTNLGVSIPGDLRQLKLRLSAKDSASAENPTDAARIVEVENLLENLRELMQEARALRTRLKGSGQTSGTKRHFGVSIEDLLDSGLLSADDKLELQWKKDGDVFPGRVLADGTVSAKTDTGWQTFKSLSTAAAEIGGRSLNGWDHWSRIEPDGSRTPLTVIRARFMENGGEG